MASNQSTVDFIVDQMSDAGEVSSKKMFGEYGIYCDGKMIASVCDNKLFIKPTSAGRAYIGDVQEAPPYPGAKPNFLILGEKWEDREWLSGLVRVTVDELPMPIKKQKKSQKVAKGK